MPVGEITDDEKKKADEEIREQQKQIDYDTKDYTIELLVQKFEKNDFFIPDYQRALMWGNAKYKRLEVRKRRKRQCVYCKHETDYSLQFGL